MGCTPPALRGSFMAAHSRSNRRPLLPLSRLLRQGVKRDLPQRAIDAASGIKLDLQ